MELFLSANLMKAPIYNVTRRITPKNEKLQTKNVKFFIKYRQIS